MKFMQDRLLQMLKLNPGYLNEFKKKGNCAEPQYLLQRKIIFQKNGQKKSKYQKF